MKHLLIMLAAALVVSCAPETPATRIAANPVRYEKLSDSHKALVQRGEINEGMNSEAVAIAWGSPNQRFDGQDGGTYTSRWDYSGRRPVYTNTFGAGFGWGRWGRSGRYGRFGPAFGLGPRVTYIPYRRASVWFRNDRVTKWERVR